MAFEDGLPLRLTRRSSDAITIECPIGPGLLNATGVVHGGVIAAIADEAVWHAMRQHFGEHRKSTTTELKVNYLRPLAGRKVVARAQLLRAGRTLCVGRVDLFDDRKRLAAVAIVTYILLDDGRHSAASKP